MLIEEKDKKLEIITYKNALINIIKLAGPLCIVNFIQIGGGYGAILTLSTLSTEELAATGIIQASQHFLSAFNVALEHPVRNLVSSYYGQLKESTAEAEIEECQYEIGSVVQQGWLMGTLSTIPQMIIMFNIKPILGLFSIPESISILVQTFFRAFFFILPIQTIINTNINLITAVDKEKLLILYNLITVGIGLAANYVLITGKLGLPAFGIAGYAYASILQNSLGVTMFSLYFLFNNDMRTFQLFKPRLVQSMKYLKDILKLGAPVAIFACESGVTGFLISMLYGKLGALRLAIEQSSGQYLTWFSGISNALARGSSIHVARAYGVQKHEDIKIYGKVSMALNASLYILPLTAFIGFPIQLAKVYIHEDISDVETLIRVSFILGAISSLESSLQMITSYNLSGLYDTFFPSVYGLICDLAILLPLAYITEALLNWDIIGIDGSLCLGTGISLALIAHRWFNKTNELSEGEAKLLVSSDDHSATGKCESIKSFFNYTPRMFKHVAQRSEEKPIVAEEVQSMDDSNSLITEM